MKWLISDVKGYNSENSEICELDLLTVKLLIK